MSTLDIAAWSTSEEQFWATMRGLGVVTDVDGTRVQSPEWSGMHFSTQTDQGWVPTDKEGNPRLGWHANIRIDGPLFEELTKGLDLDPGVFDRSWLPELWQLEHRPADPVTNLPGGYITPDGGVVLVDLADIATPANVWA